jgi:hypothetical protein
VSGILRYNGYTFPDKSTNIEITTDFVYDDKQQLIVAHRNTIVATAVITDSDNESSGDLDIDIAAIRGRLGESGKPLLLNNKGFGLDINIHPRGRADVEGGPFPQVLEWTPLGDNKACEIIWTVQVTVPVCIGPRARHFGISALNYAVDYSIDEHGNTTRTLVGYIEIARSSTSSDTADRYRANFNPPLLPNFKREQQWTVSEDKRRLSFVITDTEVDSPNPYPPSVTAIEGTHSISWGRGRQGHKPKSKIAMTIRPESGISGAFAWKLFINLANARLKNVERAGKEYFINTMEIEEDLFGRPQSFSVGYDILGSIEDFAATAGLWTPIGTTWGRWSASLTDTAFNPGGTEKLGDLGSDSVIISLCNPPATVTPNNDQRQISTQRVKLPQPFKNKMPTTDKSMAGMVSGMAILKIGAGVVRQKILQAAESAMGGYDPFAAPTSNGLPTQPNYTQESGKTPDVIQDTGVPSYTALFWGNAKRVGHPMDRLRVEKVGNAVATAIRTGFWQTAIGTFLGIPVYNARWFAEYALDIAPGDVPIPTDHSDEG